VDLIFGGVDAAGQKRASVGQPLVALLQRIRPAKIIDSGWGPQSHENHDQDRNDDPRRAGAKQESDNDRSRDEGRGHKQRPLRPASLPEDDHTDS
jgi:hypothetical protein